MEITSIRSLFREKDKYIDQVVTVGGWLRSKRDSKTFGFLVVNDGTFFEPLQVVYGDRLENFARISKLNVGAAVIVTGRLVATPDAPQPFEIQADQVEIEGESAPEYPLQKKRHSFEYLRTISHLRPRTNTFQAVFWMIEPEIAFADLTDDMMLAESMLKYVISYVLENAPEEMAFFNKFVDKGLIGRLQHVVDSDFAHVTYTEAIELLEKRNDTFEYKVSWGADLQTEHERCLTEEIFKRPVFVTDYPKDIKAFYMKMNEDGKTVAAMDCLVPGIGEIIGGSQREDDYDKLVARMEECGLSKDDYDFYLDLRKYGTARHAGFGLGFERCVMYLTGMQNIRDVIPFPRTVNNCEL